MTGSTILDVMIAMAVLYFALSMFCSAVNSFFSKFMALRQKNFESVLRSLFLDARDGNNQLLFERLLKHPLVQSLITQAERRDSRWFKTARDAIGSLVDRFRQALKAFTTPSGPAPAPPATGTPTPTPPADSFFPTTVLDSIPTSVFVQALFDIVRPLGKEWETTEPLDFDRFVRMVAVMNPEQAGPFKEVLKAMADDPEKKIQNVRGNLGTWFESILGQSNDWYETTMRKVSLGIALILCVGLNIDSLAIADRFYRDGTLRMVFVNQGTQLAKADLKDPKDTKNAVATTKELLKYLDNPLEEKKEATESTHTLPVGWSLTYINNPWDEVVSAAQKPGKWVGLFVTAFALSMGAPFWHDILKRMVGERKPATPPATDPPKTT